MASSRNVQFQSVSPTVSASFQEDEPVFNRSMRSSSSSTTKCKQHHYNDIAQEDSDEPITPLKSALHRQTSGGSSSGRNEMDRSSLSYPPEDSVDEKEDENIVVDIVTRMRRLSLPESYETVAHSLATINPLLASHAERLKMRIRIVHRDNDCETKDITPQGLLIEVLNYVREIDCLSGHISKSGLSRMPSKGNSLNYLDSSPGHTTINHDKREFIQDLRSRDIRRLETRYNVTGTNNTNNEQSPYLLIRRHCVVLCLGSFIRAIVQSNRFILVVQQDVGNEAMLNQLEASIREMLRNNNSSSQSTNSTQTMVDSVIATKSSQSHYHPSRYSSQIQTPFAVASQNIAFEASRAEISGEATAMGRKDVFIGTTVASNSLSLMPQTSMLAYEIQVYEALMTVVLSLLRQQYEDCCITTNEVLRAIGKNSLLSVTLQEQMRLLKDQVRELSTRCSSYCKLLSDILQSEDDDEYSYLYLSELAKESKLYELPISEGSKVLFSRCSDIETIFDSLLMDFEGLEKGSQSLLKKLESAEISVGLRLDASRNQLLVATTIISIISSTIAFAGFVTGAFGMNLDNSAKFEAMDGFFAAVVTICLLFIVICSTVIIVYFEDEGWIPQHDYLNSFRSLRRSVIGLFKGKFQNRRNTVDRSIVPVLQPTSQKSTLNPLIHRD